jgi:thiol-disulfide isomerase/thioredoxin
LASRLVEPNNSRDQDDEEDEEALFAELEAEIENDSSAAMREQGLSVLRQEMDRVKDMQANEHGRYTEIMNEKEVIRTSAKEPRCVIHFYHTNFKRCEIMDKHLAKLAPKYFATRFIRVFVENVPWLVEKLMIKVLPCVVCFMDGVSKDRLVGFEELGNEDVFDTATLELRLSMCGVIQKATPRSTVQTVFATSSKSLRPRDDDDEDFDLDE